MEPSEAWRDLKSNISICSNMIIYGIKNCDTVKKALKWLDDHNLNYEFHDFKKLGVSPEKLEEWAEKLGWEPLLNKKGTTWRKLEPEAQIRIKDKAAAFSLMQEKSSVIKRPLIESEGKVVIGFDETTYQQFLT